MKINPYLYPVIIWGVFVLFLIIGLMLGFTPGGGSSGGGGHGGKGASLAQPAVVQTIHAWDFQV